MFDQLKARLIDWFPALRARFAGAGARKHLRIEASRHCLDIVDLNAQRRIRISRNNAVFTLDIMNFFEYFFSSTAPVRTSIGGASVELVDFSTPRYHDIVGFADFPVFCPSLTEPLVTIKQYEDFAELKPGSVVMDLGAYSGLTSICFSKLVGAQGRVIALEPDPESFKAASRNIEQHRHVNGLDNIVLMQKAAAGTAGVLQFSAEGTLGSAAISIVGADRGTTIDVDCVSLSDIARMNGLQRLDFLKMDIEGAEEGVIAAAREFFMQFRPRIIVEPHYVAGVLSSGRIGSMLEGYGYECRTIEQYGVNLPLLTAVPR